MGKELNEAGDVAHVAEIVYHGEKLILPNGMGMGSAIDLLKSRQKYLEQKISMRDVFDVFPWDGANAIQQVLSKKFGWANSVPTPGFFGDTPPAMINVEVAPGVFREVPWGAFEIPGVSGRIQTSATQKDGRYVFVLTASILRKDEATVKDVFDGVREFLKTGSIYKGHAIKLRFLDDDGDPLEMPEPKFMDTSKIGTEMAIYSNEVQDAIRTNLFTPIQRVADCLANGISVKRGVLLGGIYGTGKTLAATVASKLAVDAGITYVYVPRADELSHAISFAQQYQSPACVIFCEDIDRAMAGERSVAMDDILNIIDGIDTKTSNVIVVLTTNDLDAINPAMLRPGRLDAVIEVLPPDAEAVQRLMRMYGGKSIEADTDLTAVGEKMKGQIPAVIAEMVKRAKLAQLTYQPAGQPVTKISEAALISAADSMAAQLRLLHARSNAEKETPRIETAMSKLINKALERSTEQIDKAHSGVVALRERLSC